MKLYKQFIQLGSINILLFIAIIYTLFNSNFEMAFVAVLMLAITLMPFYLKAAYNVHIPVMFIYTAIVFIFVSVSLGQFGGLYDRWHWLDAFLHFISAFVFGLTGFLILYVYYVHNKLKLPKSLIVLFAFFFCLGMGALWEIFEYGIDHAFGTNLQVDSLKDTMTDLILDGLGAFVSLVICSLYMSKFNTPAVDATVKILTAEALAENKEMVEATTNES